MLRSNRALIPRLVEMHAVADRVAQAVEALQEHVELGRTVTLRTIDLRPGDDEAAIVQCRELRLEAGGAGNHDRRRVQRDSSVGILSEWYSKLGRLVTLGDGKWATGQGLITRTFQEMDRSHEAGCRNYVGGCVGGGVRCRRCGAMGSVVTARGVFRRACAGETSLTAGRSRGDAQRCGCGLAMGSSPARRTASVLGLAAGAWAG